MDTRRSFLKASLLGAGACAFGSFPKTFGAATAATGGAFPKRFVFIRCGNGQLPEQLALPTLSDALKKKDADKEPLEVALAHHELPEYLRGLDPHKENMTILQGMSSRMAINGHSSWQSVLTLCRTPDGNVNTLRRASVDYELAKLFPSPLGHVELSFADMRKGIVDGWSVPAPFTKNFAYADPITAYNDLFQCVLDPEALKRDVEMFDYLHTAEGRVISTVRGPDKTAYENHVRTLASLGTRNEELLRRSAQIAAHMPDRKLVYAKGSDTAFSVERQAAMTEILASVLTSGLANVVTYTIDNLNFKNTGLPGMEQFAAGNHRIGHGELIGGVPGGEIRTKVRLHHFNQVKTIVERLKAQPEGNGTMFDNSMVMFFPEGGEKHHGSGIESPWVIMSGKNCALDIAGRYIRVPALGNEGHQTLGNWYTSLLNAHGNPIKHYGDLDSTMSRKKLRQEVPIKMFMRG